MLSRTRHGLTLWVGTGAAVLSMALAGCGGGGSSSNSGSATANANSASSAGTSSNTAPTPTTGGSGGVSLGGGRGGVTIGGGGVTGGGATGGGGRGGLTGGGGSTGGSGGVGVPGGGSLPNPGDDHGNTHMAATPASLSTPASGTIEVAGDVDVFSVDLSAGVDYTMLTSNLGAGMDSVVQLFDTNGTTLLAENDDFVAGTPTSRVDYTPALDGTYFVAVKHADAAAGTGTYEVGMVLTAVLPPPPAPDDHGNDHMSATALTLNTAQGGVIENAGDFDYFSIDLQAGQAYEFMTDNLGAGMDTILTLYDTDGTTQLDQNDDSAVSQSFSLASRIPDDPAQTFTPAAAGTYFLVVEHYSSSATGGTYDIIVMDGAAPTPPPADDHGNDVNTATALSMGAATAGMIEVSGDVDYFSVAVTASTAYTFRTVTQDDTVLTLYDDQGGFIDENDDDPQGTGFESRIDFTPSADATVFLAVSGYSTSTPGYDIIAEVGSATPTPSADDHGNDMASATPLTLGTATAGSIEVAGDEDFFSVMVTTGMDYTFRTDTQDDTTLELLDASGVSIDFNDDDPNGGTLGSYLTYSAQADAMVFLVVRGYSTSTPLYGMVAEQQGGVTPPPPPPPAAAAMLTGVELADVDGSLAASMGDTLTLTFSEDVSMVTIQPVPAPVIDPAMELGLPVQGDSFGTNATLTMGPGANEVTVTLGQDPALTLTGAFDAAMVAAGSASGLELLANTTISTASNGLPATGILDVDSTLTAGFYPGASLVTARGLGTATALDDGRVLVVGGLTDQQTFVVTNELYDMGAWTETHDPSLGGNPGGFMAAVNQATGSAFAIGRFDHAATKLANGQVLISGGFGYERYDANGSPVFEDLSSAFLFDPTTNQFAPAGVLSFPRSTHYQTLLPNGQVLISGGYNGAVNNGDGGTLPVAELFDPATATFTPLSQAGTDMVYPREAGTADVVNGKVLFAGGHLFAATQSNPTVTLYMAPGTEGFDPNMSQFAADGDLVEGRRWHTSAPLASGDLLMVGGDNGSGAITSVERYDALSGTFAKVGDLNAARSRHASTKVGENVLVVGGVSIDYTAGTVSEVQDGELYDSATNSSTSFATTNGRNSHAVVSLGANRALVVGGFTGGTSVTGMNGTAVGACELFVRP